MTIIQVGDIVELRPFDTSDPEYGKLGIVNSENSEQNVEVILHEPPPRSLYLGYFSWISPEEILLVRSRPDREQLAVMIRMLPVDDLFLELTKQYLQINSPNRYQLAAVKAMIIAVLRGDQ